MLAKCGVEHPGVAARKALPYQALPRCPKKTCFLLCLSPSPTQCTASLTPEHAAVNVNADTASVTSRSPNKALRATYDKAPGAEPTHFQDQMGFGQLCGHCEASACSGPCGE